MFITRREIFDDYCKWLFSILEEVEKSVHIRDYSVGQARLFGFMGERLLPVYVKKNKLRTKHYPILFINNDNSGYYGDSTIRNFINCFKCNMSFSFSRSWEWWLKEILKGNKRIEMR
jgi:hypothetical protein